MLRAALFDLDGVVLDTESQYTVFWEKQGLLYFPELKNFAQLIKGMTLTQIFEQYFATNTQAQKQIVEALKLYEANMNYEYIRGFEAFVTGLSKENVLTAVVTSRLSIGCDQNSRIILTRYLQARILNTVSRILIAI